MVAARAAEVARGDTRGLRARVTGGVTVGVGGRAEALAGLVVWPADDGWDGARAAWNLSADLHPAAVVYPMSAADVAATVRYASEHDLAIAFCAGGHNTEPIDFGAPTILLKTERMTGIEIDPVARTARIDAGVLAGDLAVAAGEHGLAFLSGTSPNVGVVGYALGGGLSWLAREHGLACNSIVAADVVTADGELRRIDHEHDPDLFWAIRGGSGNVAAVTALELRLFPIERVFAGALFWPIERAAEILEAWRAWHPSLPTTAESLGRLLQLPDVPFLPDAVRGRSFVLVEAAILGPERDAAALIQPLRDLGPEMDTFRSMPPSELSEVNMDPEMPVPYAGDGLLLAAFPAEAVSALVDAFVGSPLLHVEVRLLGGALAASGPDHGVLDAIDDPYVLFTFGMTPEPAVHEAVVAGVGRVLAAVAPWASGRRYLNFAEVPVDPREIFPAASFERLLRVKDAYDPDDRFHANHPVRRATASTSV
jgi:FAD/FMN-containing dehydrogenase